MMKITIGKIGILSFICILACGKKNHLAVEAASSPQPETQLASAPPTPELVKSHLTCTPLQKGTKADLATYWNDTDTATKDEYLSMKIYETNKRGLCVVKKELLEKRADVPKLFFLFGNDNGLKHIQDLVGELAQKLGSTGALLNRVACILEGNKANLDQLAKRKDVELMAWIGHGSEGDLIEFGNEKSIPPSSLESFTSQILTRVVFVSCQVGKKKAEWQTLFNKSAKIDSSKENIGVVDGLTSFYSFVDSEVATCKYLDEKK